MQLAVFQLGSRQYLIKPGQTIEVDKLPEDNQTLSTDKVLLVIEDDKVEVGEPYVKKTLNFEVVGNFKKPKVRVAVYKAKANYRRVTGQRREVTKIKLVDETKPVKKS
jgi:ribosomal protein L21